MPSSKIIISGGTGFIGSHLSKRLVSAGYKVFILSRDPGKDSTGSDSIEFIKWDLQQSDEFYKELFEDAKAVINLAGASIGKRWTDDYKKVLYDSRIDTTRKIVNIMSLCSNPPECLLSASGVGAYKDNGNNVITEESPIADDFISNLCKDWEAEAMKTSEKGVRVVISRNAVVLDKNEGALPQLMQPFKFFVGGWQGTGKQWFPWIHIDDIIKLYIWAIESDISGVINASSPDPERNKIFCKKLAKEIHRPCWLGVPSFMLRIALGEFANTLLISQRVIPEKPQKNGFVFDFPDLDKAFKNLFH